MGIKNLNKFLRNNCPEVYEEIHLSEYAFKKIAIDLTLFLCKFKATCGPRWISAFLNLVSSLRRNEIHCVFIYDSGAPPDKANERAERAENREKTERRIYELDEALEKYHNTGEIDTVLRDLHDKENKGGGSLLNKSVNKFNIKIVEEKIEKMRNYIFSITAEDFALTKKLFDILNVPYYQAPVEAETMCSDLCKRGLVDAAMSEDTDVLAYASPVFLTKIDTSSDTCTRLNYDQILTSLDLTKEQFLDLCIMCGCDYNKNVPRIGAEKAYKYLKDYGSIDGIAEKLKIDVSILNHERVRHLFTGYDQHPLTEVPFCGFPDIPVLEKFMLDNKINLNIEKLKKHFARDFVIVREDQDEEIE